MGTRSLDDAGAPDVAHAAVRTFLPAMTPSRQRTKDIDMTKTYVIQGGTDGIGAAVARALFLRGDHAVILGTNPEKAAPLLREAAGAPGSADFVRADLSLVSNTRQTVSDLLEAYPRIDGLVLCARFFRTYRSVTSEGFEDNFALFYLSRALLSYGLLPSFDKSDGAVIINAAGPGHDTPIDWDDLQSARNYDGVRAMFMTGRLNDLHGVTFAERHADRASYVLFHPGTTSTGFVGEFDRPTAAYIEQQKLLSKPATDVVPPILRLLDDPPKEPLSAFNMYNELSIRSPLFSPASAARLEDITAQLLDDVAK